MKVIVKNFLIIFLAFTIVGCDNKIKNTNKEVKTPKSESSITSVASKPNNDSQMDIKLIKKIQKTRYLLSNGIEIVDFKKPVTTACGEYVFTFPQVSGLVNKALEDNINKAIISDMGNEIKNYVLEINKIPEYMNYEVLLNANNLLSISLNGLYTPPLSGFLYRLTDGNRLHLKDIFTQGTDYVSLVNRKVTQGIIGGEQDEEDILEKPFDTIKLDQDFCLSESSLYIIFHSGESGFVNRYTVEVPLSEIDDYVNVTDLYSGTERKTQEKTNLIVRKNNIFLKESGNIVQKPNGNVWVNYQQVSGLRDLAFEQSINKTIIDAVNEAANDKKIDTLKIVPNWSQDHIAEVQIFPVFNNYGILCLERYVTSGDTNKYQSLAELDSVYSFDLINKKTINIKNMVGNYLEKNKELENKFVDQVKYYLKLQNSNVVGQFGSEIESSVNYSFIMENSMLYFAKYGEPHDMYIKLAFKGNSIKGVSDIIQCIVPIGDIIKGPLEDFFGW